MMTSAAANVAQSSSPRRRRARDYNIPVRLNGQPRASSSPSSPSPSSPSSSSSTGAAAEGAAAAPSVQVTLTSEVAPQRRVATQLVANSSQSSVERIVRLLLVLIVITVSIKVQQIHCDSQSSHLPNQSPEAGATKLTTKHSKQAAETTGSGKGPPLRAAADGTKSKRHREKLLAMLSENIERQHLKMAASMGVASLQRPSKFDSGDEFAAGSQATQLLGAAATAQSKKSDDILRNIMMLHEQQPPPPPPAASVMRLHLADNQKTDSAKLTAGASPMKLVPRLLSHIVSPLTLLGARKLSSSSSSSPVGNKLFANISLPLRPIHQAFTGRSNAGASRGSGAPLAATSAPMIQSSFLTLPNWATKTTKTKSGTRLSTAKPSTMFGQHDAGSDGSHWLMSFASAPAAATTSNQQSTSDTIDGDLMAADSSQPTSSVPAMKPASRPPSSSSSSSWRQNRGTSVSHYGDDEPPKEGDKGTKSRRTPPLVVGKWLSNGANQMAQNYLKDSFRGLFTLSQLPILPVGPVSTAPSVLEPKQPQRKRQNHNQQAQSSTLNAAATASQTTNDKKTGSDRRAKALEDLYRYAYILGTSMRRKRDPLKALSTNTRPHRPGRNFFSQRSIGQLAADNRQHIIRLAKSLQKALVGSSVGSPAKQQANPRGVMWDMATDPTLVVTLMHLIERASVALPLGFLLMPVVQMIRNPLNGINLGRVLPPRALHRSVEHELLAKRLDAVDKVLSRALRPSHRESFIGKRK